VTIYEKQMKFFKTLLLMVVFTVVTSLLWRGADGLERYSVKEYLLSETNPARDIYLQSKRMSVADIMEEVSGSDRLRVDDSLRHISTIKKTIACAAYILQFSLILFFSLLLNRISVNKEPK
jgi:hypothetical protein